jgi:hypothetical protein
MSPGKDPERQREIDSICGLIARLAADQLVALASRHAVPAIYWLRGFARPAG